MDLNFHPNMNVSDLTDHLKFRKCCSACFTRLNRRIAQLTDGSSVPKTETEPTSSIAWTEDEIETLKNCLKNSGRNWAVISQKLNGAKTSEQCKKFFYNNRKKQQLDKIVAEYKRVRKIAKMETGVLYLNQNAISTFFSC